MTCLGLNVKLNYWNTYWLTYMLCPKRVFAYRYWLVMLWGLLRLTRNTYRFTYNSFRFVVIT